MVAVARAFFDLGERLGLEWLEQEVLGLPASRASSAGRSRRCWTMCSTRAVSWLRRRWRSHPAPSPPRQSRRSWRPARRRGDGLSSVARALRAEGDGDLAGLTLAIRHLRGLAG